MIRQIAGLGLVVLLLSSAYTQNYGDEDMEQRPMEGGRGDMGTMGGRRRMNRMRGGRGGESGEMEGMADGRGGMRGGRRGMGGGRGGMDDGMGGKGGGRGGMGGDRGGMGGGRGGMGGGMGGMGGGRGGRGGMGGGRRGMGRRRGGMGGGKGGIRAMMNRRMQGNHRLDAMIDGMQNFSQDTSYDENSKLMLVYKGTFARIKGNLVGQMRLLSTRLVLLNADNEVKTALSKEVGTAIKEVTDKWNKKCQGTFAELIEEIGDNPPPADMKTAKRTLEKVAGRYISEVLKLMEKLTKKVQKQDKGWFVDGLTTNEGKLNIMRAMMKDVRRLKTFFSSELDHAMATLKPHFDDKHVPTMSESFLIKQLMNVQKRAMGEFGLNIRGMMQEAVGRDRTAPFDLEKLKSVLHETEKKKNKALKRAVKEMKAIVELNQVDPKVADLKDKLVAKSRDIFRKVKEGKAGEMAKIMHDMVQKVQGKPGAKMVEMMLRKESTQVLAEIQNKMGKAVKKHCEKALKSGGSTDEEFEKALPELREEIAEYMESAASELKKFAEEKVKEIEEGKGIFAKVKALKERQGRRKGRKGGRGGRGEMGQGGRGGMGRRGRGGMGHRGRGGMGEEGMSEEGRGRMRPRGRGGMGEEGMGEGGRGGMRPRGRGGMGEEVMGEGGMGGRRGRMPPPRGGREQRGGMEERY